MKKLLAAASVVASVIAGVAAMPAVADSTVEFTSDNGEVHTWTFQEESGTATNEVGETLSYTYAVDSGELCFIIPGGENICVKMETPGTDVGHTTRFSPVSGTDQGGTAVVTAVE